MAGPAAASAREKNAPAVPVAAAAPTESGDRSHDEMEQDLRRLAAGIGMPAERREAALGRLRTALLRGKIAAFAKDVSINGIFAYQMGEGGFLVKVKKGKGLVHLLGQQTDVPLELKSVTFGAQIGGGSEWGFGVVLGLRNPAVFGGEYRGDSRGATAGEESINITKLVKKGLTPADEAYHELYMVGAAAGLSAGAAIGTLTITVQAPQ